jgi:diguanylate cyclase (GGDEF)-like protein
MLQSDNQVDVETDPNAALFRAAEGNYELLIVSLGLENFDGLRLCSQLRSLERTRNLPILAIADGDDNGRLARGLEIGINDYLVRPIDKNEMQARVRTQIRKKRYTERLRDNVQLSIEAAITDALTGLHNRRYMESHLAALVEQASARGKPLAVLVLDIDFFKSVNDTYGHDAGDDVLREFAIRMRKSIRGIDLACRYGGEEFVIVMPETDMAVAATVAERLRRRIATEAIPDRQGKQVDRGDHFDRPRGHRKCHRYVLRTCSSGRIRRSIAPSATAAIALSRTQRRSSLQILFSVAPERQSAVLLHGVARGRADPWSFREFDAVFLSASLGKFSGKRPHLRGQQNVIRICSERQATQCSHASTTSVVEFTNCDNLNPLGDGKSAFESKACRLISQVVSIACTAVQGSLWAATMRAGSIVAHTQLPH